MEVGSGRFRRADQLEQARRSLRADILALRRELELLDEVLRTGPAPISARAARDHALYSVRSAERSWRGSRDPSDLPSVVTALEESREALEESLEALARRAGSASS
jgi:nucleotide-binding universal stress UspA family protein